MKQFEVEIMGQPYVLGCPEGGEHRLHAAVAQVDDTMNRIRDAGKVRARDRIAVLAALNLALELVDQADRRDEAPSPEVAAPTQAAPDAAAPEDAARLDALLRRLDEALAEDDAPAAEPDAPPAPTEAPPSGDLPAAADPADPASDDGPSADFSQDPESPAGALRG